MATGNRDGGGHRSGQDAEVIEVSSPAGFEPKGHKVVIIGKHPARSRGAGMVRPRQ